jgi:hypothetical protein
MSIESTTLQTMFNDFINVLKAEEKKQREAQLKNDINTFAHSTIIYEWYQKNNSDMSKAGEFQEGLVTALTQNDYQLWNQLVSLNKLSSS